MKDYLRGCRGMTAATILFLLIETALQTLSATILARLLDTAAARDAGSSSWMKPPAPRTPPTPMPSRAACCATRP